MKYFNLLPGKKKTLSFLVLILLMGVGLAFSARGADYRYLASFFNKSSRSLMILTSDDALNFSILYDGGYMGTDRSVRDPSIYRHTDGKYYVAYTTPRGLGCCDPEDHFSIAVSSDLVSWTNHKTIYPGIPGTTNTWAPEWYVDDDGSIHILVSINTNNQANYTTYRLLLHPA